MKTICISGKLFNNELKKKRVASYETPINVETWFLSICELYYKLSKDVLMPKVFVIKSNFVCENQWREPSAYSREGPYLCYEKTVLGTIKVEGKKGDIISKTFPLTWYQITNPEEYLELFLEEIISDPIAYSTSEDELFIKLALKK